jgi:tRNA-Thr(GGU) m(6)t(6)A37 methyltransferase TsaA
MWKMRYRFFRIKSRILRKGEQKNDMEINKIAVIYTDFPTKFGLPRQSGLVKELEGRIVFEPEYRNEDAVRGLEEFSHIWLLWEFSRSLRKDWSPTVRPPRLGGNVRMGVFATRSPFRPNAIGMSCVRLERIEHTQKQGPVLYVKGVDMMDKTPIYDIKPYLAYVDSHPEAVGGFTDTTPPRQLSVKLPEECAALLAPGKVEPLIHVLEQDPRPRYQNDPERIYGMEFAGWEVKFMVEKDTLQVVSIQKTENRTTKHGRKD